MKWSHLPVEGGIYDQHPQLIDEWTEIFQIQSQVEKQEQARQQRKSTPRTNVRG